MFNFHVMKYWIFGIIIFIQLSCNGNILDTIKIQSFIDSTKHYKRKNTALAYQYVDSILAQSNRKNNKWYGQGMYWKGVLFEIERNFDSAFYYLNKAAIIQNQIQNYPLLAKVQFEFASCHWIKSEYDSAIAWIQRAEQSFIKSKDTLFIAHSNVNLGILNYYQGRYDVAVRHYLKSLRGYESLGRESDAADVIMNIGEIYRHQEKFDEAIQHIEKALSTVLRTKDSTSIANCYNNLGLNYEGKKEYRKALKYHFKSLVYRSELKREESIAQSYNNIGNAYDLLQQTDSALFYYSKSLTMRKRQNDKEGIASTISNIGILYNNQHMYDSALSYLKEGESLAIEINMPYIIKGVYYEMSRAHEQKGQFKNALTYYKKYQTVKDSMFNESKSKEIGKLEARYQFEKQQEALERKERQKRLAAEMQKSRRDSLQYSAIFLFVLILFVSIFIFGRINLSERIVEGLVFFTFLLFFEFLLVLLDPTIEEISEGAPAIKLACNALLAAIIFPLHSFFESQFKYRLTNGKSN